MKECSMDNIHRWRKERKDKEGDKKIRADKKSFMLMIQGDRKAKKA